jgi:hypothetical protein
LILGFSVVWCGWAIEGTKKKDNSKPIPTIPVCTQKMILQDAKLTMIPPIRGPRAGPSTEPTMKNPTAVPLLRGSKISAMMVWPIEDLVIFHSMRH